MDRVGCARGRDSPTRFAYALAKAAAEPRRELAAAALRRWLEDSRPGRAAA
jgi:hypothetical protein